MRLTFNRDKEERCPQTPPLTLIAFTKPPSNKGKGKLKEVEESGRNSEHNEQALVLSIVKRRDEKQRSASPIWVMSPNSGAYQNEQAQGSRQQGSNLELVEILRRMEQNMQERDSQLKAQLKEGTSTLRQY